jgi:hypothetical protein
VPTTLLALYAAGVAIGLAGTDDRVTKRVLLALLWPLGPAAFVIVVSGLALVAVALWPWRLLPVAAAVAALIYWLV